MGEDQDIVIDTALSMIADRINQLEERINNIGTVELPPSIIEQYAQAKVVGYYVSLGVPIKAALQIAGINVDALDLTDKEVIESDEVINSYNETMRSLHETIKSLFIDDYTQRDIPEVDKDEGEDSEDETTEGESTNTEEETESNTST